MIGSTAAHAASTPISEDGGSDFRDHDYTLLSTNLSAKEVAEEEAPSFGS